VKTPFPLLTCPSPYRDATEEHKEKGLPHASNTHNPAEPEKQDHTKNVL